MLPPGEQGVLVRATRTVAAASVGIDVLMVADGASPQVLATVKDLDTGGVQTGAGATVADGTAHFQDARGPFAFIEGHRYDIRFNFLNGWRSEGRDKLVLNGPFGPANAFTNDAFTVLDGGGFMTIGGVNQYSLSAPWLPHVRIIEAEQARDTTPPSLTIGTSDPYDSETGWYNIRSSGEDGVPVVVEASDENGGSGLASVECTVDGDPADPAGIVLGDGEHDVACTATDAAGNRTDAAGAFAVDQHAPEVHPRVEPDPVGLLGTAHVEVEYDDAVSRVDGAPVCGTPDTSHVGRKTVECSVGDKAGNTGVGVGVYDVVYPFDGFFAPVRDGRNSARAGAAVPLKFSLGGDFGDVVTSVASAPCGGAGAVDATYSVRYDGGDEQYVVVWKTDQAWHGGCREVTVTLDDDSTHAVQFEFS
jgi:hypothetical protein